VELVKRGWNNILLFKTTSDGKSFAIKSLPLLGKGDAKTKVR